MSASEPGSLAQKVALVTGGSRGIGWALARRFAQAGATVVIASRSAPQRLPQSPSLQPSGKGSGRDTSPSVGAIEGRLSALEPPTGDPDSLPLSEGGLVGVEQLMSADEIDAIHWRPTNVARREDVTAVTRFTVERFGRIDVLVNNAGVQLEKKITATTDDDWVRLTGVNMQGLFFCCRQVIPVMQQQGGGVIINLGSISATHADPNMALYNASKAFVHGLTRSIAVDHGRDGIRCNAICPGWIMTDLAEQAFAQAADPAAARRTAIAHHPVGRLGRPEDIAAMAAWLASDEADFATGQLFTVDGGLTAGSPIKPGGA